MYNSFKQFLVEEVKTVYFTFGRMNPPTIGHGKLMDALASKSGKMPYRIFVSQSQDPKKNPLSYQDKIKFARKMFPRHARSIILNKKIRNALEAASQLHDEGYINIVMIVGSDRLAEFNALLNKYNGVDGRHGFYNFKTIKVISAGDRDPDAEGVDGMSASKMRLAAVNNDFTNFAQGLPKTIANNEAKRIFNTVRKAMGLKEQTEFKNHIQLEPVSEIRESYALDKNIFKVGEQVVIKKNGDTGYVRFHGSNYLIIESANETIRCWLDAVERVEEGGSMYADKPDWGTPESTKSAKKTTPGQDSPKKLKTFRNHSTNEGVKLKYIRDKNMGVLKMWEKGDKKWVELRGKSNFETTYDSKDPLHKAINALGKSANISDFVNGEVVSINPKHPDGKKALSTIQGLMK